MARIIYRIDGRRRMTVEAERVRVLTEAAIRCCGGQQQLADALGVTRSAICQWLSGVTRPRYEHEGRMIDIIESSEVKNDH